MALELSSFSGSGMVQLSASNTTLPPPMTQFWDAVPLSSRPTGRATARESGRGIGASTERSARTIERSTARATERRIVVGPGCDTRNGASAAPGVRRMNFREMERVQHQQTVKEHRLLRLY